MLSNVCTKYGVETKLLTIPVTANAFDAAEIYMIVDPDYTKENPAPDLLKHHTSKRVTIG